MGVGTAELAYLLAVLEDDEGRCVGDVVALGDLDLLLDADLRKRDLVGPRELLGELVVDRDDGLARLVLLVVDCTSNISDMLRAGAEGIGAYS